MLNTGLVVRDDKNQFNNMLLEDYISRMNDFGNRPNQKLLNQFAEHLATYGYKFKRDTLNVKPEKQRVVSWDHPAFVTGFRNCKVLLSSNPMFGESFLDATVFTTGTNQFKFSFVAKSPAIIYQKLINFGLIDPNKKGGDNV